MSINKAKTVLKLSIVFLLFLSNLSNVSAQVSSRPLTAPISPLTHLSLQLLLPGQELTKQAADGLAVYFSNDFDNEVGYEDSYKFTNPDENIGIVRNGKLLSIEGRKPIGSADTVPLKIWKLCQKKYTLQIITENFSSRIESYLHDAYLNTNTPLENNSETMIPFNISSDAASAAPDRFTIFFASYATLPVQLTAMKAFVLNKGVEITWKAENETNIDRYEIEQSADAKTFMTAGFVKAGNNAGITASYTWFDATQLASTRYYRIKTYEVSGEVKYTPIVKVDGGREARDVAVSTNPGQRNTLNVHFKSSSKGNYNIIVVNYSGQNVYNGSISHTGGSGSQVINIGNYLPAGLYQMIVLHDNKRENFPLLIQ